MRLPRWGSALGGLGVMLAVSAQAAPLVVLDPGHGGDQTGTRSPDGILEKTLVLALAKETRLELVRAGIEVRLTRTEDEDVPLGARPQLADRLVADAFVSIHLNHAPDRERRGWETYVLSADASDAHARRLIEQEEGSAAPAQRPLASDLAFILGELTRGVAHAQSARLARSIQDEVHGLAGVLPSRGLRQAPFVVLMGQRTPAVLVELGYLSNADQADFFSSAAGQRAAARILARGILRFLRSKN